MHHTHKFILLFVLPLALLAGLTLAFRQVQVSWYVFCAISPVALMLALVMTGLVGKMYLLKVRGKTLQEENRRLTAMIGVNEAKQNLCPSHEE